MRRATVLVAVLLASTLTFCVRAGGEDERAVTDRTLDQLGTPARTSDGVKLTAGSDRLRGAVEARGRLDPATLRARWEAAARGDLPESKPHAPSATEEEPSVKSSDELGVSAGEEAAPNDASETPATGEGDSPSEGKEAGFPIESIEVLEVELKELRASADAAEARAKQGREAITTVRQSNCPPGHFGLECEHSMKTFYFEHDVYEGFQPLQDTRFTGCSPQKDFYKQFVNEISPDLIVEVGVWRGLSLTHLAASLKEVTGGGAVIAVDTWLGAPEFWNRKFTAGRRDPERDLRLKHGYPQVYYDFLSNVVNNDIQEFVVPLPVPSRVAASLVKGNNLRPQIIHIDAAHEYDDVVEDINLWFPILEDGGLLLGDDFSRTWPGVVKAACEFAHVYSVDLHHLNHKWWIFKKNSTKIMKEIDSEAEIQVNRCISQAS